MQCRLPQKIVTPEGPWITIVITGAARDSTVNNYIAEYSSLGLGNYTRHLGDKTIKAPLSRLDQFRVHVGSSYGWRLTLNGSVYDEDEGSGGSSMSSISAPLTGILRNLTFSTVTIAFDTTDYTKYMTRANITTS